jgi:hypothetical protein
MITSSHVFLIFILLYSSFVCCSCHLSNFSKLKILRLEDRSRSCSFWMSLVAFVLARAIDSVAVIFAAAFIFALRLFAAISCQVWFLWCSQM